MSEKLTRLKSWAVPKKNWLIPLGILLAGLMVLLFVFFSAVYPQRNALTAHGQIGGSQRLASSLLEDGVPLEQRVQWEGEWQGIGVQVATFNRELSDIGFTGEVLDADGTPVASFSHVIGSLQDNRYITLPFEVGFTAPAGEYTVRIVPTGLADGDDLLFWLTNADAPAATVEGEEQAGALHLLMYGKSSFLLSYYWWVALPLLALVLGIYWLIFVKKAKPQNVFLLAASGLGILYLFVFPPYSGSDEAIHIPMSFYYANVITGGEHHSDGNYIYWQQRNIDDMDGFTSYEPRRDQYYHIANHFFEQAEDDATGEQAAWRMGQPYQYLPAALGLALAQIVGLGQVATLYLGRLFCLAAYIAVLYFAIRAAPHKTLFCLVGLIPYALTMAGSFTYDTSVTALCLFFIAYTLYVCYTRPQMRWRDIAVLAVAGLLFAPLKLVYVPLLLLPLIIPKEKWPKPWLKKVCCIALAVLAVLVVAVFGASLFLAGDQSLVAETGETPWFEEGYTYKWLLSHPTVLLRLLGATAADRLGEVVLGIGDIQYFDLPLALVLCFFAIMLLSVFPKEGESPLAPKGWQKAVMGLSSLGVYGLTLAAALPWTFLGSYYIRGAQGRYFLPLLPLVALLFWGVLRRKKQGDNLLLYAAVLLNAWGILYLFQSAIFNRTWVKPI